MKRRTILIAVTAVVVLLGAAVVVLPSLPSRCQRWYHTVDYVTDKRVVSQYGMDIIALQRRMGTKNALTIRNEVWAEVTQEVGAKPFYCS